MSSLVIFLVTDRGETLATERTRIGLLPGVAPHVHFQVLFIAENLPTVLKGTREGVASRMARLLVMVEASVSRKLLSTVFLLAHVGNVWVVAYPVVLQMLEELVRFSAPLVLTNISSQGKLLESLRSESYVRLEMGLQVAAVPKVFDTTNQRTS